MRDMLRRMPPELQEAYHIMSIAKANGESGWHSAKENVVGLSVRIFACIEVRRASMRVP